MKYAGYRHGGDRKNIIRLRKNAGLSVKDIQTCLQLSTPNAIYKWQNGESLPTLDNLVILAEMLGVSIDEVIVTKRF